MSALKLFSVLQCLVLLAMLFSKSASGDSDQGQRSVMSWQEVQRQLQANENAWAPPGTFAAALSTFQAALQVADKSTDSLKKVPILSLFLMLSRSSSLQQH